MMEINVKPVNKDQWPDFAALFSSKGAPNYCWCASWRMNAKELGAADSATKREFMRRRIMADIPVGLLAYFDGTGIQG